ncbi:MAG: hypothetical protein ACHQFX_17235 [Chitinophagales bacterium]
MELKTLDLITNDLMECLDELCIKTNCQPLFYSFNAKREKAGNSILKNEPKYNEY